MLAGVAQVIVGVDCSVVVASDIVSTSKLVAPSVQIRPIWPLATRGYPDRKLRLCVPLPVFGTVAHGDHVVPLYLVYRIEFAVSVLTANSQMLLAPSVAAKSPAPLLKACPVPKAGGAGDIGAHALLAAEYDAPSTPLLVAL